MKTYTIIFSDFDDCVELQTSVGGKFACSKLFKSVSCLVNYLRRKGIEVSMDNVVLI